MHIVEVAINHDSSLTWESLDSLLDGRNLGITQLLKIDVREEALLVKVFPQEWFTNQAQKLRRREWRGQGIYLLGKRPACVQGVARKM